MHQRSFATPWPEVPEMMSRNRTQPTPAAPAGANENDPATSPLLAPWERSLRRSGVRALWRYGPARFNGVNVAVEVDHQPVFAAEEGGWLIGFVPHRADREQVILAKSGFDAALRVALRQGRVFALLRDGDAACELVSEAVIRAGRPTVLALSFGAGGFRLDLDDVNHAHSPFAGSLGRNVHPLSLGAPAERAGSAGFFNGRIEGLWVCDRPLPPGAPAG